MQNFASVAAYTFCLFWPVCVTQLVYSKMPPKRATSAKVRGAKANVDNAGDKSFCRRTVHSPPPKPADLVDEGTKEYYLMQIRDLEKRIAR